jgi:hypothetical protein
MGQRLFAVRAVQLVSDVDRGVNENTVHWTASPQKLTASDPVANGPRVMVHRGI